MKIYTPVSFMGLFVMGFGIIYIYITLIQIMSPQQPMKKKGFGHLKTSKKLYHQKPLKKFRFPGSQWKIII